MKGIFFVSLVTVITNCVFAVPKCPPGNGALLPNPSDCTSYYECLNGTPILMHCPPGLEWSAELERCEYPNIAKCKETETPEPTKAPIATTTKNPGEIPKECPPENGPEDVFLPNPADCGSFFKCYDGIPQLVECPEGQEWSVELSRCEWPEIAKCVETETTPNVPRTTTTSGPSTEKPTECPDEDGPEDVLLPNPEDCGSFFKCLNGEKQLIKCPEGQEWSTELNRCDWPEIAQCKESSKSLLNDNGQCPDEDGPDDILLPNPADCGSFFKCAGGKPILLECPAGLHWSVEYNQCDYPEIAKCKETETTTSTEKPTENPNPETSSKPPTEKPTKCPAEDGPEDVLLPNPDDCGSFFKCSLEEPILLKCPPGLHWSTELDRCEFPDIAKCEVFRKFQKILSLTFQNWPTECPLENGQYDYFLPNLEDCSTYYRCDHGVKFLMECPVGTLWHAPMYRCDHAHLAECATA